MIGRIIGNYQITGELASGSRGMIYRGHHTNLLREVVIKELLLSHFPVSTRVQLKARFRRETFIHSQLDHPGIVRLYEAFAKGDNYYLVMEYVAGISLRELLDRQGLPTPAQALYLCKQALAALDYAHNFRYLTESDVQRKGVIHRDLKPANLLIDGRGKSKITDFGIVKMPNGDSMAPPSFRPGTAEYMPPEQLRGLDLDVRSDIYSLGVTFCEMLTGQLPFSRSSRNTDDPLPSGFLDSGPAIISELRPDIPLMLSSILMRAITRNPSERFQTASEFLKAIKEYERSSGAAEMPSRLLTAKPSEGTPDSVTIVEIAGNSDQSSPSRQTAAQLSPNLSTRSIKPANQRAEIEEQAQTDTPISQSQILPQALKGRAPEQAQRAERSDELQISSGPPHQNGSNAITSFEYLNKNSRGRQKVLKVATAALITLGLLAGGYFFILKQSIQQKSSSRLESGMAANVAAPVTTANAATPQPEQPVINVDSGDIGKLQEAREADRLGKFNQAAALYEEYLRSGPTDRNAATISDQLGKLKKFIAYLNTARAAFNRQDYQAARQNYAEALKLRPYSKLVQNGIVRSDARLSDAPDTPKEADPPPKRPENPDPE